MKRKIAISVATVLTLVTASACSFIEKDNKYVNLVQESVYPAYSVTYEDAFNSYFENCKWENNDNIVTVSGKCSYLGKEVDAKVKFSVALDNKQCSIFEVDLNDVKQENFKASSIVNTAFVSYENEHNLEYSFDKAIIGSWDNISSHHQMIVTENEFDSTPYSILFVDDDNSKMRIAVTYSSIVRNETVIYDISLLENGTKMLAEKMEYVSGDEPMTSSTNDVYTRADFSSDSSDIQKMQKYSLDYIMDSWDVSGEKLDITSSEYNGNPYRTIYSDKQTLVFIVDEDGTKTEYKFDLPEDGRSAVISFYNDASGEYSGEEQAVRYNSATGKPYEIKSVNPLCGTWDSDGYTLIIDDKTFDGFNYSIDSQDGNTYILTVDDGYNLKRMVELSADGQSAMMYLEASYGGFTGGSQYYKVGG